MCYPLRMGKKPFILKPDNEDIARLTTPMKITNNKFDDDCLHIFCKWKGHNTRLVLISTEYEEHKAIYLDWEEIDSFEKAINAAIKDFRARAALKTVEEED